MSDASAAKAVIAAPNSFQPLRRAQRASLRSGGATGQPGDQYPGSLNAPSIRSSQCFAFQAVQRLPMPAFCPPGEDDLTHRTREVTRAAEAVLMASRDAAARRQIDRASWQTACTVGHTRFCSAISGSEGAVLLRHGASVGEAPLPINSQNT